MHVPTTDGVTVHRVLFNVDDLPTQPPSQSGVEYVVPKIKRAMQATHYVGELAGLLPQGAISAVGFALAHPFPVGASLPVRRDSPGELVWFVGGWGDAAAYNNCVANAACVLRLSARWGCDTLGLMSRDRHRRPAGRQVATAFNPSEPNIFEWGDSTAGVAVNLTAAGHVWTGAVSVYLNTPRLSVRKTADSLHQEGLELELLVSALGAVAGNHYLHI